MLAIRIRRHHARHAGQSSREMPHAPLPEKYRPLIAWLECKARGEWTNPLLEDWYLALQRDFRQWEQRQAARP